MFLIVGLSESSPLYTLLRAIYNFEKFLPHYVPFIVLILSGAATLIVGTGILCTISLCVLILCYGISCLYVWTLFLVPFYCRNPSFMKLRGGLSFFDSVKIYRELHVMTLIVSELAREFLNPCMHYATCVVVSTLALYHVILQFMPQTVTASPFLIGMCSMALGICVMIEFFAICLIARAGAGSQLFLQRSKRLHGDNKYARKVFSALLPNSINLELIRSVDTLKNGVETNFFLRFFSCVTDNTLTLLLAIK